MNLKENELLAFLGINFFMGYHSLLSYKNFWSLQEDLGVPLVSRTKNRNRFQQILWNRFQQILSFLHINDNSSIPYENKDKIYKIRPVVTALNERFDVLHNGSRELSIDESMIIFKGRSSFKQYNPKKTIKTGYKRRCIADQYVKNFIVYQGKDEVADEKFKDYGLVGKVMLSLSENYWGNYRKLYFDNYFTSVELLERFK